MGNPEIVPEHFREEEIKKQNKTQETMGKLFYGPIGSDRKEKMDEAKKLAQLAQGKDVEDAEKIFKKLEENEHIDSRRREEFIKNAENIAEKLKKIPSLELVFGQSREKYNFDFEAYSINGASTDSKGAAKMLKDNKNLKTDDVSINMRLLSVASKGAKPEKANMLVSVPLNNYLAGGMKAFIAQMHITIDNIFGAAYQEQFNKKRAELLNSANQKPVESQKTGENKKNMDVINKAASAQKGSVVILGGQSGQEAFIIIDIPKKGPKYFSISPDGAIFKHGRGSNKPEKVTLTEILAEISKP